jgi:hypothetical protein
MPFPCRFHAALCRGLEKSLSERHGRGQWRAEEGFEGSNTPLPEILKF